MTIECKTTNEVSDSEISEIYSLFEEVFEKKRSNAFFREEYGNTPMGYSYHSILRDDKNKIVGFHSCMPFYYYDNDRRFLAGLGIDSMVAKEYRDFFSFYDMVEACKKRLKDDGFDLRIGFPNDNSYPVLKKGLKHKDIGKLKTYCLLRNVGAVKPKLEFANILSRAFSKLQILGSYLSLEKEKYDFRFHKDHESFDKVRYKWFEGDYKKIELKDFVFYYRVKNHEGVMTAFLLDVFPLSRRNFENAVRYIYRHERKKIDMILYVGFLPFTPICLLTLPRKFEPKNFNFVCFPLNKDKFDEGLYDIKNWDVNLSNYDLI